jgi:hypothetical protein
VSQVEACPKIHPLLRQCGIKPERVIEVLSADLEPDSMKLIQMWDDLLPRERVMLGLEGLALAVGISPRRLWELYCGANLMQSRESIGAMIANSLPAIMAVTIKDAKKVKGFASREHIYKAARVLPTPKGTIINLPGAQQKELEESDNGEPDPEDYQAADDLLLRASKAMGKALPPPTIEADIEEDEEDDDD